MLRVNRAADAAAVAAFAAGVRAGTPKLKDALRPFVAAEVKRFGLASPYPTVVTTQLVAAMAANPSKPPRFREYQAIELEPSYHKWSDPERVSLPTYKGKRQFTVALDHRTGAIPLHPPFAGKLIAIVRRGTDIDLDDLS